MNDRPKEEAVICLGAGTSQIPVLDAIRKRGYRAIAVDRNPQAAGFKRADVGLVLSTFDAGPIISALAGLENRCKFSGLMNRSSGPPVVTAAAARTIIHKADLNEALRTGGVPVPTHQTVCSLREIDWERISFPVVMKPSLSLVGKQAVIFAENAQRIRSEFSSVQQAALDGRVEIQQFISGTDVGLIAMLDGGTLRPFAWIDEMNAFDDRGILRTTGVSIPSQHTPDCRRLLLKLSERMVEVLDLSQSSSPFLVSFRCPHLDQGEPVVIEIHPDLGGDRIIEELLPAATDFDFLDFALQVMTSQPVETPRVRFRPTTVLVNNST